MTPEADDAVIAAMARAMHEDDGYGPWDEEDSRRQERYCDLASAALRAALAVRDACRGCKGTGEQAAYAPETTEWLPHGECSVCGGSGEAPSLLDEAVELLREWRFQWDNTCCFPDAATDAFLARLRVEVTPK